MNKNPLVPSERIILKEKEFSKRTPFLVPLCFSEAPLAKRKLQPAMC